MLYKIQEQAVPTTKQRPFPEAVALLYDPLPGSPCQQEAELWALWLPLSCYCWGTVWFHWIYSHFPSVSQGEAAVEPRVCHKGLYDISIPSASKVHSGSYVP